MWRVHILDRINAKRPAKLLDSGSLTLGFWFKQIWPVFLCNTAKLQNQRCKKGPLCNRIELLGNRLKQVLKYNMRWESETAHRERQLALVEATVAKLPAGAEIEANRKTTR